MKLQIRDRVIIDSILPVEGNYVDLVTYRDIRKNIELNKDEVGTIKINGNMQHFEDSSEKSFKFTSAEKIKILDAFEKLSKEGKLHTSHLDTYEKIKNDK